jgi:hypothetical protein
VEGGSRSHGRDEIGTYIGTETGTFVVARLGPRHRGGLVCMDCGAYL